MGLADVVAQFAATAVGVDAPDPYVRIRTGETRRSASTAVSKIPVGQDPAGLAAELERRLDGLAGDGYAWLEVLARGDGSVLEVAAVQLPEIGGAPAGEEQDRALGALVTTVRELAGVVRGLALGATARAHQLEQERTALVAELASLQTAASLDVATDREDRMGAALQTLSPIAWGIAQRLGVPVAAVMGAGEAPPPAAPAGTDDADALVAALVARVEADPGALTRDRMGRILAAGQRAMQRQREQEQGAPPAPPGAGSS